MLGWKAVPWAIARFVLLGAQAGLAAAALYFVVACHGACGGYFEAIVATGVGIATALVACIALMVHYAHHFKTNPQRLISQARIQWIWLGVSGIVLFLVYT